MDLIKPNRLVSMTIFISQLDKLLKSGKISPYSFIISSTNYAILLKTSAKKIKNLTQFKNVTVNKLSSKRKFYPIIKHKNDLLCNYMSGFIYNKIEDLVTLNLEFKNNN